MPGDISDVPRFHVPAAHVHDQITTVQDLQHDLRMVSRLSFLLAGRIYLLEIESLNDHVNDPRRGVFFQQMHIKIIIDKLKIYFLGLTVRRGYSMMI
jgi:hypothetical protein